MQLPRPLTPTAKVAEAGPTPHSIATVTPRRILDVRKVSLLTIQASGRIWDPSSIASDHRRTSNWVQFLRQCSGVLEGEDFARQPLARALQFVSLILQRPRPAGIRPAALVAALRRCPAIAPTLAGCHQKSRHRAPNSREAGGAAANRPVGSVFSRHSVASRMRAGRKPPEGDEAQPPGGGYPVSSPRELQPNKSTSTRKLRRHAQTVPPSISISRGAAGVRLSRPRLIGGLLPTGEHLERLQAAPDPILRRPHGAAGRPR